MPQRPFVPTPLQTTLVERIAAMHCTVAEIIGCIPWGQPSGRPISEPTLRAHFGPALAKGRARAAVALKQLAFDMAVAGDRTMLIFLLKTKHGYSETVKVETTGRDEEPLRSAGPVFYVAEDLPSAPAASQSPQPQQSQQSPQPARGLLPSPRTAPAHAPSAEPEPHIHAAGTVRPTGRFYPAAADPRC